MKHNKFIVQCVMEDLMLPPTLGPEEVLAKVQEAQEQQNNIDAVTGEELLTAGGAFSDPTSEPPEKRAARVRALMHLPSLCSKMGEKWTAIEALPYLLRCIDEEEQPLVRAVADIIPELGTANKFTCPVAPFDVEAQAQLIGALLSSTYDSVRQHVLENIVPAVFISTPQIVPSSFSNHGQRVLNAIPHLTHLKEFHVLVDTLLASPWPTQRAAAACLTGFATESGCLFLHEVENLRSSGHLSFGGDGRSSSSSAGNGDDQAEVMLSELEELLEDLCQKFRTHFLQPNPKTREVTVDPAVDPLVLAAVLETIPKLVDRDPSAMDCRPSSSKSHGVSSSSNRSSSITVAEAEQRNAMLSFPTAMKLFRHCVHNGIGAGMDRQRRLPPSQRFFPNDSIVDEGVVRSLVNCGVELLRIGSKAPLIAREKWAIYKQQHEGGAGAAHHHSQPHHSSGLPMSTAINTHNQAPIPGHISVEYASAILTFAQEVAIRPLVDLIVDEEKSSTSDTNVSLNNTLYRDLSPGGTNCQTRSSDWQFRWLMASNMHLLSSLQVDMTAEVVERQTRIFSKLDGRNAESLLHHLNFFVNVFLQKAFMALCTDPEEEVRIAGGESLSKMLAPLMHSHTLTFFGHQVENLDEATETAAKRRLASLTDQLVSAHCVTVANSKQNAPAATSHLSDFLSFMLNLSQLSIMDTAERVRAQSVVVMASVARALGLWRRLIKREWRLTGEFDFTRPSSTLTGNSDAPTPEDILDAPAGLVNEQKELLRIMADLLHDESYLVQLDAISVISHFLDAFGSDVVARELESLVERLLRNPLWRIRATLGIVVPNLILEFLRIAMSPASSGASEHAAAAKMFITNKLVPLFINVLLDQVQAVRDVALSNLQNHVLTADTNIVAPFLNDLLWPALADSRLANRNYIMRVALINAAAVLVDPPPIEKVVGKVANPGGDGRSKSGGVHPSNKTAPSSRSGSVSAAGVERDHSVEPLSRGASRSREGSIAADNRPQQANAKLQNMFVPHMGDAAGELHHSSPSRHAILSTPADHIAALDMNRHFIPLIEKAATDSVANVRMRAARAVWQVLCPGKEMLGYRIMRSDPIASTRGDADDEANVVGAKRGDNARKTIFTKEQRDRCLLPLLRTLADDPDKDVREAAASAIAHCT